MSGPIATIDPATPKIPDHLWQRSGSPLSGWLVRAWIAMLLIAAGAVIASLSGSVYAWALAAVGVAAFFAIPPLVESLVLARLAAKVDAVEQSHDADKAHAVLDDLRKNSTVKMLAPHGWLFVQEGRIHLAVGDGRAAAKSFAEAERVSTDAGDKHELTSAQAHALVLAGDRKDARELLAKLRKADALSDLDHLNFGVVLLSEAGHNQEALTHFERAREAFGAHPRALAGQLLALQRCDKIEEAAALLGEAEAAVEASNDQIAQDLLKRGKKALRPLLKAKQKRERKAEKQVEASEAADAGKQRKPKGKKGRKQARRDARKKAKAEVRRGDEVVDEAAVAETPIESSAAAEEAGIESSSDQEESLAAEDELTSSSEESESDEGDEDEGDEDEGNEDEVEAEPEAETPSEPEAETPEPKVETSPEPKVETPPEPKVETPKSALAEAMADIQALASESSASASSSGSARRKPDEDEEDGIDLASLAREALGSGTRRKLDDSEGGPGGSGIRAIEPNSSASMFRSAVFDEPKPKSPSASASSSLFDLPKFDSMPTFAPPPKPKRGSLLSSREDEPKPEAKPTPKAEAKPAPIPSIPAAPSIPKAPSIPAAPSIPKAPSIPAAPSIPNLSAPKPSAPKPVPAPALDEGWGELGDIDPFAAPPIAPTPSGKSED